MSQQILDMVEKASLKAEIADFAIGDTVDVHTKILEGDLALAGGDTGSAIDAFTQANGILDTWIAHFDLGRASTRLGHRKVRQVRTSRNSDRCLG